MRRLVKGRNGLVFAAAIAFLAACCGPSSAQTRDTRADHFKLLRLDGHDVRWPRRDADQDIVLTYRVLKEFQAFDGARNCRGMSGVGALLESSALSEAGFRAELGAALAMWEQAADIHFREALEDEKADIMIGAQAEPEGWAFADVFYDVAAPAVIKPITRSLVCLNPKRHWKIGFDGNLNVYDLRYTLAHEIGHAIGLDHPNGAGQMMGYRYEERFRALQEGDVSGAVAIFGPARGTTDVTTSSVSAPSAPAPLQGASSRALHSKPE